MELKFQFANFAEFVAMAGHGPYVWACYGIGLACLIALALSPLRSRKALLSELQRTIRIEEHEKKQREKQQQSAAET